jgi:hypothetical protein
MTRKRAGASPPPASHGLDQISTALARRIPNTAMVVGGDFAGASFAHAIAGGLRRRTIAEGLLQPEAAPTCRLATKVSGASAAGRCSKELAWFAACDCRHCNACRPGTGPLDARCGAHADRFSRQVSAGALAGHPSPGMAIDQLVAQALRP